MTYLIVAGGVLLEPEQMKNRLPKWDKVIAVDSGYDHCISLEIKPDVLIGDLDSVKSTLQYGLCELMTANPEKDDTDLKLAVDQAITNGARHITIVCGTGGRMDHFLNNLSILDYVYAKGIECEMVDEVNRITILEGKQSYINSSKYISLIPITDSIVASAENLKYPMDKMKISRENIISVSNEATKDTFTLDIIEGKAFLIQAD